MSLWSEFTNNRQRPIHKWTHYFPVYERHFAPFRNTSATLLEIGCGAGGSLQMWKRWLGPLATIVGIDIDPEAREYEEDQIHVRIGDQKDPRLLSEITEEFGPFDAVLDDGSHMMADIAATFDHLYPTMPTTGVYIVEDLQTAYRAKYGGGLGREGSFIEVSKQLIDRLNAHHAGRGLVPDEFTATTGSIHFYDGMVVFERGRHRAPRTAVSRPGGVTVREPRAPAPAEDAPPPVTPRSGRRAGARFRRR